ncbi:hypothetical protein OE88DRAFT_1738023 [Heliocybe sulcata]|uniref:Uncharacterized protein n=1 Tax=Heliocybe sulcata TaxID=5364 RepID=A0A5C3MVY8_9AGAM|nr:hypothetical protein OE88DRAFT_1738023 [Heliocybe sulcata]
MATLPSRHDPVAPLFDPTHPESLHRYFEDVEDLFGAFLESAKSDFTKKHLVVKYIPLEVEELWRSLSEFRAECAYAVFKSAVQRLYPTIAPEHRWRVEDLERVVRKRSEEEMRDVAALSQFHQEFVRIAQPLRSHSFISEQELDRAFSSAFGPSLWGRTFLCLQIIHPSHSPHRVHPFRDVYDAALFVLQSADIYRHPALAHLLPDNSAHLQTPSPASPAISPALIDDIIATVTQRVAPLIPTPSPSAQKHDPAPSVLVPPPVLESLHSDECHYCGARGCRITRCPLAMSDIASGMCKRNEEGRLVLPSGRFIPRSLPGATMHERMHIWHMRYPVRERTNVQNPRAPSSRASKRAQESRGSVPERAHVFGAEEPERDVATPSTPPHTRTARTVSHTAPQPSLSMSDAIPIPSDTSAATYTIAKASRSPYRLSATFHMPQAVECVVDPGESVNMVSEALCDALSIAFDPGVQLAACAGVGGDPSLGLARNIPIVVEGHSFIVQAHVVRDAAYSVLLGAPFVSAFAALEPAEPL